MQAALRLAAEDDNAKVATAVLSATAGKIINRIAFRRRNAVGPSFSAEFGDLG